MTTINLVTEGAHAGKSVSAALGSIVINTSTFKTIEISKKTIEDFEVLKSSKHKDSKSYTISLIFKSGEKCQLLVDDKIHDAFLKIWPDKKEDRLKKLLKEGYSIVGFSSFDFSSSGLGAGYISHNILLQKELNVEKVSFIVSGDKQLDAKGHIFSSE